MPFRGAAGAFLRRASPLPPRHGLHSASSRQSPHAFSLPVCSSGRSKFYDDCRFGGDRWWKHCCDLPLRVFLYGQAAIVLGMSHQSALAEEVPEGLRSKSGSGGDITGLQKIEDGSIISNIHTSKWRVFTDQGRELFLQGQLDNAEKLFLSALKEAREGFGEKDPHVASACNNLAELYRVRKIFDRAEPLYLEAINILESSYGPEDIRVGTAFHNLGQFYLMQRKLEEARSSYERALKIKGRALGINHTDCTSTMHHLGVALYLLGNEKDAEALIVNSIRILEDAGQAESVTCIKRLRYLAQIYLKSGRLDEAEIVQSKIHHLIELAKARA